MNYETPFQGIRVIDLTQGLAGPEAGMMLAQYGADVIKVEPLSGDWSRSQGERFGDFTDKTVINNRGKRSIALDLKTTGGKEVLRRLVSEADVFMEAFRPGVIGRLGFGYEAVTTLNPSLIYLSISGFGHTGPFRERPATDAVLQAFSGLMQVNRGSVDDLPHRVGTWPIDMITGLYAFQAISVALYARLSQQGQGVASEGRFIDCSLMQSAAAIQAIRIIEFALAGGEGLSSETLVGSFRTSDGWMNLSVMNDAAWARFCAALDRPDLIADPRFAVISDRFQNDVAAKAEVQAVLEKSPWAHWTPRLTEARILHERVNDYIEFLEHPQTKAANAVNWIDHPDIGRIPVANIPGVTAPGPEDARAHAPGLGSHGPEIMADLGFSQTEVQSLADAGAVGGVVNGPSD